MEMKLLIPMEISVTDFSAPFGPNVFKFCVHLQDGKVYCVNGIENAYPHFAFFFQFCIFFLLSLLYNTYSRTFFSIKDFSATP